MVAGGGSLPDSIYLEAIALAGGAASPVLIVPQASRNFEDAGVRNAARFVSHGCTDVSVLDLSEEAQALVQVAAARLIWISGGSQNRLMERLSPAVEAAIRECHANGCVVGGTSAGAAVMSQQMITGRAALDKLEAGATALAPGLGLWPKAIVDQHFHRRRRFNRLLAAVADQPHLFGVGIDEGTAVILEGERLRVVGDSSVLLLSAHRAAIVEYEGPVGPLPAPKKSPLGVWNMDLHVLHPGMSL